MRGKTATNTKQKTTTNKTIRIETKKGKNCKTNIRTSSTHQEKSTKRKKQQSNT